MNVNNKTFVIVGLIAIGLCALFFKNNDLALAIGSGLVGYLSKDAEIHINRLDEEEDIDEFGENNNTEI